MTESITHWYRTCQECLHIQIDNAPKQGQQPTDAYLNRKCRKCKSESLDYGSERTEQEISDMTARRKAGN